MSPCVYIKSEETEFIDCKFDQGHIDFNKFKPRKSDVQYDTNCARSRFPPVGIPCFYPMFYTTVIEYSLVMCGHTDKEEPLLTNMQITIYCLLDPSFCPYF